MSVTFLLLGWMEAIDGEERVYLAYSCVRIRFHCVGEAWPQLTDVLV